MKENVNKKKNQQQTSCEKSRMYERLLIDSKSEKNCATIDGA